MQNQIDLNKKISAKILKLIQQVEKSYEKRVRDYRLSLVLHEKGLGAKEIARSLGYSHLTISNWLHNNIKPIKRFPSELVRKLKRKNNLTAEEISRLLGIKQISVYYHTRRNKSKRTKHELSHNLLAYIRTNPISTRFLNYFWKNTSKEDNRNFVDYCRFVKLSERYKTSLIARELKRSLSTVRDWKYNKRIPRVVRLLNLYLKLGEPSKGRKWMFPDLGPGGIPLSRAIQVPTRIKNWKDIQIVLDQLEGKNAKLPLPKSECFAFLLGVYVGDACKFTKDKDNVGLILSKKKERNKKFGEFFCECIRKLGFRAKMTKRPRGKLKWRSRESPFFSWIYRVVLGLKENETTTHTPIRAKWLLKSPLSVVKRFLQGIFESDGCVQYDGIISCSTYPNNALLKLLLWRFGIRAREGKSGKWKPLLINYSDLKKCDVLFAKEIKSEKYHQLRMIINANRLERGKRYPSKIINEFRKMMKSGYSDYKIAKDLLIRYNLFVPRTTIQYHRKRWKNERPEG